MTIFQSFAKHILCIGFTGTRKGMTDAQQGTLISYLDSLRIYQIHHGGCRGADIQVHRIAFALRIRRIIHPPINQCCVGYYGDAELILPSKSFIERDHDIVDACDLLIAAPAGKEVLRSGTWATVRYARSISKPIIIIYPDGSTTKSLDLMSQI